MEKTRWFMSRLRVQQTPLTPRFVKLIAAVHIRWLARLKSCYKCNNAPYIGSKATQRFKVGKGDLSSHEPMENALKPNHGIFHPVFSLAMLL